VLIFMTAIPKEPLKAGVHPAGIAPVGVMISVTPCGAGRGEAWTTATAARRARVYRMMSTRVVSHPDMYRTGEKMSDNIANKC
jgi:hypothetical protein